MRIAMTLLTLCLAPQPLRATEFFNLSPESHLSGPEEEAKDTEGRVVLVADFGFRCPRCRACLPKLAEFAKSLAKDKRFLMLGAHMQDRNEEAVKAMLRETGAEGLPTYQFLHAEGAPTSQMLPFAYVIDHIGEFVWSGDPGQETDALKEAVRAAIKRVPERIPGSLIPGTEVLYNKEMTKRLVAGKNIERALKTLRARAQQDTPQGREAAALAELCELWAEERTAAIDADLEEYPSRALAAMKELNATMPSVTGRYKDTYRTLMRDKSVAALASIRQAAAKLDALTDAKRKSASARSLTQRLKNLSLDNADAADVKALLEGYLE